MNRGVDSTNVLILCTHNSARSVLAEGMLNHWVKNLGRPIRAFSAGSTPRGGVNPLAIRVLMDAGIETDYLRSKSWDEFSSPSAPTMRVVITVCDSAAAEPCPLWPGSPVRTHWRYADPSTSSGDRIGAFELTRQAIGYRMHQLARLPVESMSDVELANALTRIERS